MPLTSREKPAVSTLALIVLTLVALAFVSVPGALAYLAYRHPSARGPMTVAIATVAAMATIVVPIVLR
ncbi:hypothetical protein ACFU96_10175 [Streptomyces sp. NPDC057620]|uniref:hypothetical protein n=1 Tax=Streptomyces sp. NPDC057620 TaxID=3346185 RepID=UPI0036900EE3